MPGLKKGIGVAGSITIDNIVAANQNILKLGGVPTYAGITYRRHGMVTFIVSNLAERDLRYLDGLTDKKRFLFY